MYLRGYRLIHETAADPQEASIAYPCRAIFALLNRPPSTRAEVAEVAGWGAMTLEKIASGD